MENLDNNADLSALDLANQDKSEDLTALLKSNLEMTKEIRAMVKHINNYVAWQRLFAWIKVFLILIPLIIGALYLPPLLKDVFSQYSSLLNGGLN